MDERARALFHQGSISAELTSYLANLSNSHYGEGNDNACSISEMSGAEMMVEWLVQEKTEYIFGLTGGAILPFVDALNLNQHRMTLVNVIHEQGAGHMAEGYSIASGKTGVCYATSGPGATNLVTPLMDALMDSRNIIAITGQVPTHVIGSDAFQEAPVTQITSQTTKHNYLVETLEELLEVLPEAFHIAKSGRQGPVLVDVPKNVQNSRGMPFFRLPKRQKIVAEIDCSLAEKLDRTAEMVKKSKRPIIYAGGGIISSNASEILTAFSERLHVPVTNTLMGRGGFSDYHENSLGMPGMHGSYAANYALNESDFILAVGVRFDDRVCGDYKRFAPYANVVHIDIDNTELGKNIGATNRKIHSVSNGHFGDRLEFIGIHGDAGIVLEKLVSIIDSKHDTPNTVDWWKQIQEWKVEYPLAYKESDTIIKPQYVLEQLSKLIGGSGIVSTDVGQHQMWAAQYIKRDKPRTWITSGGLGTMGFGFPAAIGAKFAKPDETSILITSEGSFKMLLTQAETMMQYNKPVIIINLCNESLGMVSQWEDKFYESRHLASRYVASPDIARIMSAYGIEALRITEPKDVVSALDKALSSGSSNAAYLEFKTDPSEHVLPMIPSGQSYRDIIMPEIIPNI